MFLLLIFEWNGMMSHIRSRKFHICRDVFHKFFISIIIHLWFDMWYVAYVCVDLDAYLPIQVRNFISDHTIPWFGGRVQMGPRNRLRSCHLQWSPSWSGDRKQGGVGEGLELRLPARVAQQWQQAQQQAQQQQDQPDTTRLKLHGLVGDSYNLWFVTITGRTQGIILPTSKSLAKVLLPKVQGLSECTIRWKSFKFIIHLHQLWSPPKRVQFNEIHHNPVQHGLISIFTSWFNIDTLHDIKRDMFWTREEDWYPRPSKNNSDTGMLMTRGHIYICIYITHTHTGGTAIETYVFIYENIIIPSSTDELTLFLFAWSLVCLIWFELLDNSFVCSDCM